MKWNSEQYSLPTQFILLLIAKRKHLILHSTKAIIISVYKILHKVSHTSVQFYISSCSNLDRKTKTQYNNDICLLRSVLQAHAPPNASFFVTWLFDIQTSLMKLFNTFPIISIIDFNTVLRKQLITRPAAINWTLILCIGVRYSYC